MREETPEQRKRVLIVGWTILAVMFLVACGAIVLALWPAGQKPSEPHPLNQPIEP
jgi:hypothetical protein